MERLPTTDTATRSSAFKDYAEEELYIQARKRVEKIKGFYIHFAVYIVINLFLLGIIYFNMSANENFWSFGHFSTAFFWGIGIVFHALGVFGSNMLFSKKWEERKIQEYMSSNKRKWE